MRITVTTDLREVEAWARKVAEDQVPFATALALTRTAQIVRDEERELMRRVFDRPTRFTLNSLFLRPATKHRLWAEVWLKDTGDAAAAQYLRPQIVGGDRSIKRFERHLQAAGVMPSGWIAVPGKGVRLNAFGNMSPGQITQVLSVLQAQPDIAQRETFRSRTKAKRQGKMRDYFVSTPAAPAKAGNGGRLPYGVYQRIGKRIVTIFFFAPKANYTPRFDFFGRAKQVVDLHLAEEMRKAVARALETAR